MRTIHFLWSIDFQSGWSTSKGNIPTVPREGKNRDVDSVVRMWRPLSGIERTKWHLCGVIQYVPLKARLVRSACCLLQRLCINKMSPPCTGASCLRGQPRLFLSFVTETSIRVFTNTLILRREGHGRKGLSATVTRSATVCSGAAIGNFSDPTKRRTTPRFRNARHERWKSIIVTRSYP